MNLLVAMRYLVALDKHRHFGRAAQACHITQPALSNALRSLENSFGVPIVKRSRTYGGLTAEGEVVLESARRQLREMELLEQDLHSANDGPRGALSLAAVPTAVPLLALFAAMLQRQHAGLRPVVLVMSSPGIEAGLQDLSIDLALGYVERKPHRNRNLAIASLPLFEEQYYFLRRATTRAAGRLRVGAEMRWAEAARQPLCLLTPDMHFRSIVDGALAQGGAAPEPVIETNSLWALGLSVAAGEVATILPGAMIAAFRTHGDLEALPLVAPDLRTPVGILSRAKERPSRAVQAALTLLRHPEWETLLARYVGERSERPLIRLPNGPIRRSDWTRSCIDTSLLKAPWMWGSAGFMSDSEKPVKEQKIEFYEGPAGGWGALKSVKNALLKHNIAVKGARTLLSANQPDGFDCPGCAWPDRNHASTFEFCENGVKAVASEATARRTGPAVFNQYSVSELAGKSDFWLEDQGRLTHPMVYDRASDRYLPIEWDAAFVLIAGHLNGLDDPNEAIFYTSGRTSNEAAFLYQLFVREFGTNNFPDCSNMCHEPSGSAMRGSIGIGKGTVTLHDFELTEAIFVFGQNPGTNHPRMLGELRAANKRGARIVSFNPMRERGLERFADPQSKLEMATLGSMPISTHYFQLRGGGDLAAVKGMMKRLVEREDAGERLLDRDFIAQHTLGFEAVLADIRAQPWDEIIEESGLTREQIAAAGDVYCDAKSAIFCWGMGITQHQNSVATIQTMMNLLLLRGNVGRPGAGPCPVRGHSNVQGDRTMGIWEKPPAALLDRLREVFGFEPPCEPGYDTVESIHAMLAGKGKVFFAMGGNFAAATPDTVETWKALRRCRLTVHVATKLNRSHLVHGREALILPCLGRTEIDIQAGGPQSVSVEDSMSMVHLSAGINPPASPLLLSEPAIVARLAQATLGGRSKVSWLPLIDDYARIRDLIERVFPDFRDFNERVAVPGGFRLYNGASERVWTTATKKAHFFAHPVPRDTPVHRARRKIKDAIVFTLQTTRSHDQYNTTIYGHDDRYRGVFGQRRVLFINRDDIHALGFHNGDWVDILTVWDDGQDRRADRFKLVAYDIPRGNIAAYYPETNPLVPLSSVAFNAGTPTSKSIPVVLVPHKSETAEAEKNEELVALEA